MLESATAVPAFEMLMVKVNVTCRPILVYMPEDVYVVIEPDVGTGTGVQVPSSYQFSNSLVIPGALALAVKLMPLAAVPCIRLPVPSVWSPVNDCAASVLAAVKLALGVVITLVAPALGPATCNTPVVAFD